MRAQFIERYGVEATLEIRSPGRVNLIGEHTDYSLLPVMPIAIDRGITLLAAPAPPGVLRAMSLTEPEVADIDLAAPLGPGHGWLVYLHAALGALGARTPLADRGALLLLDADLPSTGGLSSSAALLVGLFETLNELWELGLERPTLPELTTVAEHSLGLENGGMDQTVVALASAGHALRIDFGPLRWQHVPVPERIRFVAAYSGEKAHKGAGANLKYNTVVASCRAATLSIAHRLGIDLTGLPVVLRSVASHPDAEAAAASLSESVTAAAVAARIGVDVGSIVQLTAKRLDDELLLNLRSAGMHVLSEARRVDEAQAALEADDIATFGRLLDASHESLRYFGTSSPALDRLTAAMRSAGALGARVTGAGFGGYAVAAAEEHTVDAVLAAAIEATGGPAMMVEAADGVHRAR